MGVVSGREGGLKIRTRDGGPPWLQTVGSGHLTAPPPQLLALARGMTQDSAPQPLCGSVSPTEKGRMISRALKRIPESHCRDPVCHKPPKGVASSPPRGPLGGAQGSGRSCSPGSSMPGGPLIGWGLPPHWVCRAQGAHGKGTIY